MSRERTACYRAVMLVGYMAATERKKGPVAFTGRTGSEA